MQRGVLPQAGKVALTSSYLDLLQILQFYNIIDESLESYLNKQLMIPIVSDAESMRIVGSVKVEKCLKYFIDRLSELNENIQMIKFFEKNNNFT